MNKKLRILISAIALAMLPAIGLAQPAVPGVVNLNAGLWGVIAGFINLIVWPLFAGAGVLMFMIAGFFFLTANGDTNKLQSARSAVIWGTVGIVVGLLAYSVVQVIRVTIGV